MLPHTGHCPELGGLSGGKRTAIHYEGGCYSMTSSARARIDGGTVSPSALRLMTRRIVPGCSTALNVGIIH